MRTWPDSPRPQLFAAPFDAPVQRIDIVFGEVCGCRHIHRLGCAAAFGVDCRVDAVALQEIGDGLGAALGQLLIIIVSAAPVGMADEDDATGLLLLQRFQQFLGGLGADRGKLDLSKSKVIGTGMETGTMPRTFSE